MSQGNAVADVVPSEVLVIGAGVIGLAAASELASHAAVVVLDRYPKFGQETSSRNSEVVHSGIHYPPASFKTRWCIEGREALYAYCRDRGIPHAKIGKFVVATTPSETEYLTKLAAHCKSLQVPCEPVTGARISQSEPLVRAEAGLFFPETGIVDSHVFMASLERAITEKEGVIAYRSTVTGISRTPNGWRVETEGAGGNLAVEARIVVNAAGLAAAELTNLALSTSRYEHRLCRGRYFAVPGYTRKFKHLVYPVPRKDGLGVHVTLDMGGNVRLGPDVDWCEGVGYREHTRLYDCDWEGLLPAFLASVRAYCPGIPEGALTPGLIGIRPKLFIDGKARPDFLVENHQGWIHCLGIESPGLTSALAIAKKVSELALGG